MLKEVLIPAMIIMKIFSASNMMIPPPKKNHQYIHKSFQES